MPDNFLFTNKTTKYANANWDLIANGLHINLLSPIATFTMMNVRKIV